MHKELTIAVEVDVYDGLCRLVGPRRVGQLVEERVRPHVAEDDLSAACADMAADEARSSGRMLSRRREPMKRGEAWRADFAPSVGGGSGCSARPSC